MNTQVWRGEGYVFLCNCLKIQFPLPPPKKKDIEFWFYFAVVRKYKAEFSTVTAEVTQLHFQALLCHM